MYITHIQSFGPFLKLFGQIKKSEAIGVERAIYDVIGQLNQQSPPQIIQLNPGTICLAKSADSKYYRSQVLNVKNNGLATVKFIDYGNETEITINEVIIIISFVLF